MNTFLNFCEHLALTVWFGAIIFFSFLVTPALFAVLGKIEAGKAVRAIFPRYYLLGIVCGIMLTAVHVIRGLLFYWGGLTKPAIVLFALLTALNLYARQVLIPAIHAAREGGPPSQAKFDSLHRRSVLINVFVLLCGIAYLYWVAVRGY